MPLAFLLSVPFCSSLGHRSADLVGSPIQGPSIHILLLFPLSLLLWYQSRIDWVQQRETNWDRLTYWIVSYNASLSLDRSQHLWCQKMHFGRYLRDGNLSRSDYGFPFFLFNSLQPNFPLFLGYILFYVRRDCLLLGLEEGLGSTLKGS